MYRYLGRYSWFSYKDRLPNKKKRYLSNFTIPIFGCVVFGATSTSGDMLPQFQYRTARMLTMPYGDIPLIKPPNDSNIGQTLTHAFQRLAFGCAVQIWVMKHDDNNIPQYSKVSKVVGGRSNRITPWFIGVSCSVGRRDGISKPFVTKLIAAG